LSLDTTDSRSNALSVDGVFTALATHERQGFHFRLVGHPVGIKITETELEADSMHLVPVIVLVISLVTWSLCRSWRLTALAIGTLLVSWPGPSACSGGSGGRGPPSCRSWLPVCW
ncbi:MAG TPA: hypothetical protein VML54_00060, partial [Candidatus Limnocylindrales bacterium]|nr:hypothetical protein [Candidatus Limnocylindrales bacterium]